MAIYVPAINLLVVRDSWCRHLLSVYFPPDLARWFINQAALNGPLLVPYLARGARRIASVMRGQPGTHLGHQLWNELSGMEYLLTCAQGDQIPEWIIPGARNGIELWGPIEALFPELRRRVNRDLQHGSDVMPYVYAQGHLRGARHPRAGFGGAAPPAAAYHADGPGLCRYPPAGRAVACPGRAGDHSRAAGREPHAGRHHRFFRDVIRLVAQVWPGATVVIDGHNSREAAKPDGESRPAAKRQQGRGDRKPRRIAGHAFAAGDRARDRVRAAPRRPGSDVTILDTLGAGMASSLAWALLCDCFLSVWGASLAKFRWVCNKPGLVVSSQANLLHRDDLHIYDSPQYMESPTPLLFADPAAVVDDPDAPRLVPVSLGNPFFANFRVDHGRVLAQFRRPGERGARMAASMRQRHRAETMPVGARATRNGRKAPHSDEMIPMRERLCLV